MNKAKVTMLIVSYNEKEYLPRAIESCMRQTYDNKEILVGDDGSNDGSIEYLEQFGAGIRYFVMSRDQNPVSIIPSFRVSNVIKRALDESESEYFVSLSGDDYFTDPTMIERAVNFLEENKDYCAYIHGMAYVSEEGKELSRRTLRCKPVTYWSGEYIHMSCFVFRKLSSKELLNHLCDDTGLQYVLATKGKWKFDDRIVFSYVQRTQSIMHEADKFELSLLELLLLQDVQNYGNHGTALRLATKSRFYYPVKYLVEHRELIKNEKYGKYIKALTENNSDLISQIEKGKYDRTMRLCRILFSLIRKIK